MLTVGSLFAGIGGFDLGFERAGFRTVWQVENDGKAQSVLSLRFPDTALHNDVRTANGLERVDVICGGFPCQDVSVAGTRKGLIGERTGLFWQIVRIARELEPRWMVLENVPGLLSSHGGRDFYAVLVALAECGFRRAYRILDSRYFGVPQRRRRVFIVLRAGGLGDGPGAILFEPESSDRDSQASAAARARVAATLRGRSHGAGVNEPGRGGEDDRNLVLAQNGGDIQVSDRLGAISASYERQTSGDLIFQDSEYGVKGYPEAGTLRAGRIPEHQMVFATLNSGGNAGGFRTEPGERLIEVSRPLVQSMWKGHDDDTDTLIPTLLGSMGHHGYGSDRGDGSTVIAATLKAYSGRNQIEATYLPIQDTSSREKRQNGDGIGREGDPAFTLDTTGLQGVGVRRLTPLECERLQGFPDGWTCLCGNGAKGSQFCTCADSPRYRQLGNAVTVPVAEWIARRIAMVEL